MPSVEAMMMVLPEDDGPNSLVRSTLMVRMLPSTLISTFFMLVLLLLSTGLYPSVHLLHSSQEADRTRTPSSRCENQVTIRPSVPILPRQLKERQIMATKDTAAQDEKLRFHCKNCGARFSSGPGLAKHRRESIVCRPAGWVNSRAKGEVETAVSAVDLMKQAARVLRMEIEAKRQQLRDMDKLKAEIAELESKVSAITKLIPATPPV